MLSSSEQGKVPTPVSAAFLKLQVALKSGPKAAAQAAKRHYLHTQTLEQLAEMRCQLAAMVADARLVAPGGARGGGGYGDGEGGGGGRGKAALAATAAWLDDPTAPWNAHARDPVMVRGGMG